MEVTYSAFSAILTYLYVFHKLLTRLSENPLATKISYISEEEKSYYLKAKRELDSCNCILKPCIG